MGCEENDLYSELRAILLVGRCLGVLPVSGLYRNTLSGLKYGVSGFAGITTLCCAATCTFAFLMGVIKAFGEPKRNPFELANSYLDAIYGMLGAFIYTYFLCHGELFLKMLKIWNECQRQLHLTLPDKGLRYTVIIISVSILGSAVSKNVLMHIDQFTAFDSVLNPKGKLGQGSGSQNGSFLQMYYKQHHPLWNTLLGSHPTWALLAFVTHQLIFYAGNYVDVMICLFARALYFKFYALCATAEAILVQPVKDWQKDENHLSTKSERQAWNQLARDHGALCDLLDCMNNFFSPLIFVSYGVNIYFVCMQLLIGLGPAPTVADTTRSIYVPWSLLHVIARLFMLSVCLAKVNVHAHAVGNIVLRCPADLFTTGVIAKLEKRVNSSTQLGFTGLGFYTVTKSFMLSILNVIFTIEIVLLQGLESRA